MRMATFWQKLYIVYRWPSLYAVFLSAFSCIFDPEMTFFWNISANYQSSLVFLYVNSLYASLFLESLSLAYNEVQLYWVLSFLQLLW